MKRTELACIACLLLSMIAMLLLGSTQPATAQPDRATVDEGTEFWVIFPQNFRNFIRDTDGTETPSARLQQTLTLNASEQTRVRIEFGGSGGAETMVLEPGRTLVPIDSSMQLTDVGLIAGKGIRVVSEHPISVVASSHRYQTTDAYTVLPSEGLGTRYRVAAYKWLASDLLSQCAVLATEDRTTLTLHPSVKTESGHSAGEPVTVELNAGEVYRIRAAFDPRTDSDLTGSLIESNRPVAIFSGHNCAYVPKRDYKACNLLVEQLRPTIDYGTAFVLSPFAPRLSATARIIADEQGTVVQIGDDQSVELSAGAFHDQLFSVPLSLRSNKPVQVVAYTHGFTYPEPPLLRADSIGDPMMVTIPPIDAFSQQHQVFASREGSWHVYATIVVPTTSVSEVFVGTERVDAGVFTKVPSTDYSVGAIEILNGSQTVTCSEPVGVLVHGTGYADKQFDAYGHVAPRVSTTVFTDGMPEISELEVESERQPASEAPTWRPIERLDAR